MGSIGDPGGGNRAQDRQVAQSAVGLLDVGLQQVRQLTVAGRPLADGGLQVRQAPGRQRPPVGEHGGLQGRRGRLVTGHRPGIQESEHDLDVGGGHATGLGDRAHRVVQPEPGVPDRVPEPVGDLGDRAPGVQQDEVQVAAGTQLTPAVAAHGHECCPGLRGAGGLEQLRQPLVGQGRQRLARLTARPALGGEEVGAGGQEPVAGRELGRGGGHGVLSGNGGSGEWDDPPPWPGDGSSHLPWPATGRPGRARRCARARRPRPGWSTPCRLRCARSGRSW